MPSPINEICHMTRFPDLDAPESYETGGYRPFPIPGMTPEKRKQIDEAFFAGRLAEAQAHDAQVRKNREAGWKRGAKTRAKNRRAAKAAAKKTAKCI